MGLHLKSPLVWFYERMGENNGYVETYDGNKRNEIKSERREKAIVLGADNAYMDKVETTIKSLCVHLL